MSTKYLGHSFDIHGGGIDLKFPHHEAEIAQNNSSNNQPGPNYWIHGNMLTVDVKWRNLKVTDLRQKSSYQVIISYWKEAIAP